MPGDPSTVYLRSTFGILQSKDGGKTWRWICEKALGYEGQWDPSIAVTRDGRLWVGLETGVTSSADGCKFERAPELEGETVKDITTDGKGETVYIATGAPGKVGHVWRHKPGATAWEKLWPLDDVNVMTIDVAPSNPQRVYLSGESYSTIRGQIFRSDDGGLTFKTDKGDGGASASGLKADGPLFIGAIDKQDPNRLLVRHLHAHGSDLLLSKDAGKTFENVLSLKSAMFGFAFSEDGKTYWAGSGLKEDGLFRSDDRGAHFELVSHEGVLCLHSAPTTLFVCGNPFTYNQTTIARSDDRGATVTPIAKFSDIQGPLECTGVCADVWPTTRESVIAPPAESSAASDLPPDAGRKKKKRRDGGANAEPETPPSSKCGCEVVGAQTNGLGMGGKPSSNWLGLSVVISALFAYTVRRRSSVNQASGLDR